MIDILVRQHHTEFISPIKADQTFLIQVTIEFRRLLQTKIRTDETQFQPFLKTFGLELHFEQREQQGLHEKADQGCSKTSTFCAQTEQAASQSETLLLALN